MTSIIPRIKLKANWPPDFLRDDTRTFKEITTNFPEMLNHITDKSNVISIYDYFGKSGVGKANSRKYLKPIIPQMGNNEDFKGIYIFWFDNEAFYTGISRGVIKRIHQHIKGTSHLTSSLCYTMGKEFHKESLGIAHKNTRKELNFKKYSEPFKKKLREECQVSLLPVESSIELYLFEVYVAVELDLHYYNKFETH